MTAFPPIYVFPPIPTPPTTCNAPEEDDKLSYLLIITAFPPIFIFSPIPTPPTTRKAPEVELLELTPDPI